MRFTVYYICQSGYDNDYQFDTLESALLFAKDLPKECSSLEVSDNFGNVYEV